MRCSRFTVEIVQFSPSTDVYLEGDVDCTKGSPRNIEVRSTPTTVQLAAATQEEPIAARANRVRAR